MHFYLGIIIVIIGILAFAGAVQRTLTKTTVIPALCRGCQRSIAAKGPDSYYPVFEYDMYGKRYTSRSLLHEYKKKSKEYSDGTWHYIQVSTSDPRVIFHRALTIWNHILIYSLCILVIGVGVVLILR